MANKKQVNKTAMPSNDEQVAVPVTVQKNGTNGMLAKVKALGRTEWHCPDLVNAIESVKQGYNAVLWYYDPNGQRRDAIFLAPFYNVRDGKIKVIATAMSDIRDEAETLPIKILHKGHEVTAEAVKKAHREKCRERLETDHRRAKLDRVTCDKIAECPKCGHRFAVTKHLV